MALVVNGRATEEGPRTKKWSVHDVRETQPLTSNQRDMFRLWYEGNHICAHGSAGTGKTFVALYLALNEVLKKQQQRIIIVRSVVPTREIGFLPGTLEEKLTVYEQPYQDIMHELCGKPSTYNDMKEAGLIEFVSTSYVRGLTWDNAIVVVDECENLTFHEIDSVMTRMGNNSRMIVTGDVTQTDLDNKRNQSEGMSDAIKVFRNMHSIEEVQFNRHDIVRGEFVKNWIIASEDTLAR